MSEMTLHSKDVEITMGLLIEIEQVIPTEKLRALISGEEIEITYRQQLEIIDLITDLEQQDIAAMSPEEVAMELGFFTARLATHSERGRLLSMALPFFAMSPDEVSQLLETLTTLYPQLKEMISNSLAERLVATKESTGPSVNFES